MKEPLTGPAIPFGRENQESGPEDQHRDEGLEVGGWAPGSDEQSRRCQVLTWFSGVPGVVLSLEVLFFFLPLPLRPRPFFFPLPFRRRGAGVSVSGSSCLGA